MKVQVTLSHHEVFSIVGEYVREKFNHMVGKGEWLEILRVGEPGPDFTMTIESKRRSTSD